jgi:hypothetical protein
MFLSKSLGVFNPVPTAVPPIGNLLSKSIAQVIDFKLD